ncbi:MAG: hypothetical protein JRE58_02425 [Deltaproteobacteria bacterium]|nr:hypothetical protein [Deltaproteobacteria bacterium]
MKKIATILLISTLLISTVVFAKPFITTAPTDSEITHYVLTNEDAGTSETVPAEDLGDGTVRCHYDVAPLDLSNGNHNFTTKGINDLWGLETNPIPFVFNKPATLEDPAGIGLSAE